MSIYYNSFDFGFSISLEKIKKIIFGLSNQPFGVSIKQSIEKLVQTLKTPEIIS